MGKYVCGFRQAKRTAHAEKAASLESQGDGLLCSTGDSED